MGWECARVCCTLAFMVAFITPRELQPEVHREKSCWCAVKKFVVSHKMNQNYVIIKISDA